MAAEYRFTRPMPMASRDVRPHAGGSPLVASVDRSELLACVAYVLLVGTMVLVFGLLISFGPAAGGPLR